MARKKKTPATEEPSLFGSKQRAVAPSSDWILVTNHRNLCYMLAAAMVMPPAGFVRKYYEDTLALRPGWIPLFRGAVPEAAIQDAIAEGRGSIPCLVRIRIDGMAGPAVAVGSDGGAREIIMPPTHWDEVALLLVPAPLPTTWITGIAFRNDQDLQDFQRYAESMDNVKIAGLSLEVEKVTYGSGAVLHWPLELPELTDLNRSPDIPLAYGALMAMLTRFSSRSDRSVAAAILAFDPAEIPVHGLGGILSSLGWWCAMGSAGSIDDVSSRLFWSAVEAVASSRSLDPPCDPLDVLLAHLQARAGDLDVRFREAITKLAAELRGISGLGDFTIREIFERHPKPFSRAMAMFFLRENCLDLARFEHPSLSPDDILNAAVLFAARDGWIGLPVELRSVRGLEEAVAHRMAALGQKLAGTGVHLGDPPARPRFAREWFVGGQEHWSPRQHAAAVELARRKRWDCIRTTISLGKGEYRLRIDAKGAHLELDGDIASPLPEIQRDSFLEHLGHSQLEAADLERVRKLIEG